MIDRDARRQLGRLMRNFATGRITNDAFDDAFEDIDSVDKGCLLGRRGDASPTSTNIATSALIGAISSGQGASSDGGAVAAVFADGP